MWTQEKISTSGLGSPRLCTIFQLRVVSLELRIVMFKSLDLFDGSLELILGLFRMCCSYAGHTLSQSSHGSILRM